ncbi:2OG-Fe(II) oxygenase [Variovorax sp. EL159]|uniref:2OG-Fe(II) oxygenase n=1 Tax=Variovorax sp. EL159 TaxID=1566270 RepID=UPI000885E38A|nr:2OG-Fe(II) oxygenase [Variovorax sp. EL159]SCX72950.1 2OG-Fe(II) oxygenase superfamily protein [Variovorax sp. EL159]
MAELNSWVVEDINRTTPNLSAIKKFSTGDRAGLRFENFLHEYQIDLILHAISEIGIEYYEGDDKAGGVVRKGKLGPNFFRFKSDQDEYFRRTRIFEEIFDQRILGLVNFFPRVQEVASKMFSLGHGVAEHQGSRMMNFTVRVLPEAPIHRDWMPGEDTGLSFAPQIKEQFAWNIYLKTPKSGGQTRIYKEQDPALVGEESEHFEVAPRVGDLIIFRTTQAHEVLPSDGDRLTLSGFFGTTPEKLLFWI